jgi:predicted nucleotidyltransferase
MGIDPRTMAGYCRTAEHREARRRAEDAERRARAMAAARRASALLRADFAASRVVAFGSLVDDDGRWFGIRSDIDLAARLAAGG